MINRCRAILLGAVVLMGAPLWAEQQEYREIKWTDLLPESDLQAILNAPEVTHDGEEKLHSLPMEGLVPDNFELDAEDEAAREFQQALVSTKVRSEFDGRKIRIPGFMVPLEFDGHKNVIEFFLVPYFGACIHMPPPPPNQIIHIRNPDGYYLNKLFDPVWVEGTVHTTTTEKSDVKAVYTMSSVKIRKYEEPADK